MAFTDTNLAELRRFVASARKLLVEEFDGQLKAFGLHASEGRVFDLEPLRPNLSDEEFALAQTLRQRLEHLRAALPAATASDTARAIAELLAEQAFTILNRFAAIRMAEERKLVIETIGKGFDSGGFRVWSRVFDRYFPQTYERYRAFWNATCDEISLDLGVLFDRDSLQGLLFPRENALYRLFDLMNAPGVAALWGEDETIGWIYQYFNDRDQIRESKAESAAPRNSRELAERNQFFTPRYVVEFLTDNTLGRLWWEMTEGQTALAQTCEFLAMEPDEAPPFRLIKDPRDIKMLDPACGSMHFGLYAFDLFLVIYDEAWDKMPDLRAEFEGNRAAYARLVPKWICERNIWGVDIDPRAAQIAALSLWLRAGRAWNEAKIALGERPPIAATRIVCAAPMPGDVTTLRDFTARLNNTTLADLVEAAWEKMTLAGEAGTLLQIEKDLKEAIELAQKQSFHLFAETRADKFWDEAEKKMSQTLRDFTLEIAAGGGLERQMFAADAGRGLAFIDLCREKFDVVLMNPPFGESAMATKAYLKKAYPRTKNDIYAAFVERGIELLERNSDDSVSSSAPETSIVPPTVSLPTVAVTPTLETSNAVPEPVINEDELGDGLVERHFRIQHGDVGHSYESIFGEYLRGATKIYLEDPYLRQPHQLLNLVRFCELLAKTPGMAHLEILTNCPDADQQMDIEDKFAQLSTSLLDFGIVMEWDWSDTLHNRKIETDTGWVIKMDRGLDIYQRPDNWFSVGAQDFELRRCLEIEVNIFHAAAVATV